MGTQTPRNKPLLGREEEIRAFEQLIAEAGQQPEGALWLIEGPAGIGKSALLTRFQQICVEQERPHLKLNDPQVAADGEAVLKAICQNGAGLDHLQKLALGEVWPFVKGLEQYKDSIGAFKELLRDALWDHLDAEQKGGAGWLGQVAKMLAGVLFSAQKQQAEDTKAALKAQPEKTLLRWLADEGRRRPVLLLDTFEHALAQTSVIQSQLDMGLAEQDGTVVPAVSKTAEPLERFLRAMITVLTRHGWTVVVAGRRFSAALRQQQTRQIPLTGLSAEVIARDWLPPVLARYPLVHIDAQQRHRLAHRVHGVSYGGNPLWLNVMRAVLEAQLAQGLAVGALADGAALPTGLPMGETRQRADEVRNKADLLEVVFRGEKLEMAQAWRLALPSRLTAERLKALFPTGDDGRKLFMRLEAIGLFTGGSSDATGYELHEEVRDLLLWWGESQQLHQTEATRQDHRALLEILKRERPDLADLSWVDTKTNRYLSEEFSLLFADPKSQRWSRDAIMHGCLSREYFENQPPTNIKWSSSDFHELLSGSSSLHGGQKWRIAGSLDTLSDFQISSLFEAFSEENILFEKIFGKSIARQLRRDVSFGRTSGVGTVDWWLRCIQLENHHPAACYGLFDTQTADALRKYSIGSDDAKRIREKMQAGSANYSLEENIKWAEALSSMAVKLDELDLPLDAIATYDEVVRRFGDDPAPALREQVAMALFNKGYRLEAVRPLDAIATYNEIVRRFGDDPAPALRERVAKALRNKGVTLGQQGQPLDEIATFDEIVRRFGDDPAPALCELVANALFNKGVTLGQQGQPLDAIATFDEIVRRFGDDPAPALCELVAKALVNKGVTLGQQGQPLDEIATYDEVVRRFGDDPAPALREQVAKALFSKGYRLETVRPLDAIATYDEVVRRFGDDPAPALCELVAKALVNKGVTLGQQGQPLDKIATYDEVVRRFGDDPAPALRERVAQTRNGIGFTRLIQAKTETSPEMRNQQWAMALDLFRTALEGCAAEDRAMVLGNVAYASVLLGNPTAGRTALQEALALGGEALYDATLDDLRQHPIPEDAPMHALLQACWAEQQAGG